MGYVAIHLFREFWAMSKKSMILEAEEMDLADGKNDDSFLIDKQTLSRFDTIQLFTYSIALYIGGVIGDTFDIRKLLTIAYALLAFAYFLLGLGAHK
jgi:hypothetical protein